MTEFKSHLELSRQIRHSFCKPVSTTNSKHWSYKGLITFHVWHIICANFSKFCFCNWKIICHFQNSSQDSTDKSIYFCHFLKLKSWLIWSCLSCVPRQLLDCTSKYADMQELRWIQAKKDVDVLRYNINGEKIEAPQKSVS